MKVVYLGAPREVTARNGMRIRLREGEAYLGELAEWLKASWPEQFRSEPVADPPRLTVDVVPGEIVTKD